MMRIVYMGTPPFAVPTLMEIAGQGHEIAAVYTTAAASGGAGVMGERRSAVHEVRRTLALDVRHPETLNVCVRHAEENRGARMAAR